MYSDRVSLPVYCSGDYWLSTPEIRGIVDEQRRKKREMELRERLELARKSPSQYLAKYGPQYYYRF